MQGCCFFGKQSAGLLFFWKTKCRTAVFFTKANFMEKKFGCRESNEDPAYFSNWHELLGTAFAWMSAKQ